MNTRIKNLANEIKSLKKECENMMRDPDPGMKRSGNFGDFILSEIEKKFALVAKTLTFDIWVKVRYFDCDDKEKFCVQTFNNPDDAFYYASETICFSDCSNYDVVEIYIEGQSYHYVGWRPNMEYVFVNDETNEIAYDRFFPHWDH